MTEEPHVVALRSLARDLEDAELVVSLAQTYLGELGGRVDLIVNAGHARDLEVFRKSAHSLKSTSALMGLADLAGLCREAEHVVEIAEVDDLIDRFIASSQEAELTLTAWVQAQSPSSATE